MKIKQFIITCVVFILLFISLQNVKAQQSNAVQYGDNPGAGQYLKVEDGTRIYYEVYGKGKPIVLLHGGLFGDISEYEKLIPKLSEHFRVIAIETRGHAKSEIGHQPFTYELMAQDAYAVIKHITTDSTIVIGFSDGAVIGMKLTLTHPEMVIKLVFAGGNISKEDYRPGVVDDLEKITGKTMEHDYPGFVKDRKKMMPEPERWDDFVEMLKHAWLTQVKVDPSQLENVKCPVLVLGGDRDQYNTVDNFYHVYKQLPHASLAIIPQSDHIVFYRQPDIMEAIVLPFVEH